MNLTATMVLAFGMSMDAFAASVGKGATLDRPRFSEAIRTGAIFGLVEAITPVIGWGLGLGASAYVAAWDHWVAFGLLLVLGGRMIHAGLTAKDAPEARARRHSLGLLVATAIATSLDALAVGVGLAFLDVNILSTATAIGLSTLVMATLGMLVGRMLGPLVGRAAEILGGVTLITIGTHILIDHLGL